MSSSHVYPTRFNPFNMDSPSPTLKIFDSLPPRLSLSNVTHTTRSNISHGGPARKRQRQSESSSHADSDSTVRWEYHPTFGIVHRYGGCSTCDSYVDHMASATGNSEFQEAIAQRDEKCDTYFFDGFSEGRRRQRDDDFYLYDERQHFRDRLQTATNALDESKANYLALQEELNNIKQKLFAREAECERLKASAGRQTHILDGSGSQRLSPITSLDSSSVGSFVDLPLSHLDQEISNDTTVLSWPPPPLVKATQRDPRSHYTTEPPNESKPQPSAPQPVPVQTQSLPTNTYPPYAFSDRSDLQVTPARSGGANTRQPRTLDDLKSLMEQAHKPGNEPALAQIKALCAKAHITPREQKTSLQRFLLANWRNPTSTPSSYSSIVSSQPQSTTALSPKMNPRMDDPVEVWYKYLCTHQHSWPRGVRRDHLNRPFITDLRASRAVARLRPEIPALRTEYITCVTDLFSIPGAYSQLLEKHHLVVNSSVSFIPFPGQSPVTVEDIARHFSDCGFTTLNAAQDFEAWARCHRDSFSPSLSYNGVMPSI